MNDWALTYANPKRYTFAHANEKRYTMHKIYTLAWWDYLRSVCDFIWIAASDDNTLIDVLNGRRITVTGKDWTGDVIPATSTATFAMAADADLIADDWDGLWFDEMGVPKQVTIADLTVKDYVGTVVNYSNSEPYNVSAIAVPKITRLFTAEDINNLSRDFKLWLLWANKFNDFGYLKDNRDMSIRIGIGIRQIDNIAVAPVPQSAAVENDARNKVVINFDIDLDPLSVPDTSAFTISGKTISQVEISGLTVTLTVTVAFIVGNSITVSYVKPALNPLQTVLNGSVATFTNLAVTNNILNPFPVGVFAKWGMVGDANDDSGNGYNLTNVGTCPLTTDRNGAADRAYDFSAGKYLRRDAGVSSTIFVKSKFTVAFWFKFDTLNDWDTLLGMYDWGGLGSGWGIYKTGANIRFSINVWNANKVDKAFSDTTGWHHLIASYDSSLGSNNMKMRIDNGADAVANYTGAPSTAGNFFAIGYNAFGGVDHKISQVYYWDRELTDAEKTEVYNYVEV